MHAEWSTAKGGAFVCEAEDLKRLTTLLESKVGEVSWKIMCADGLTRSGDEITTLLEFDNDPDRKIQGLHLRGGGYAAGCRASVQLGGSFKVLNMSIDGPADFVEELRPILESQLSGIRAWYTHISQVSWYAIVMVVFALFFLGVSLVIVSNFDEVIAQSFQFTNMVISAMVGLFFGVFTLSLNKIRDKLFPPVTFAIGQGKRRYDNMEKVRWSVIIAFVVSLGAGLVFL